MKRFLLCTRPSILTTHPSIDLDYTLQNCKKQITAVICFLFFFQIVFLGIFIQVHQTTIFLKFLYLNWVMNELFC